MSATRKRHPWPHDELADDFEQALGCSPYGGTPDTRWVGVGEPRVEPVTMYEVKAVERWHVSYHCTKWEPGKPTGTELELCAVLRLRGGLWASVVAGNDYTGWGCQDHSDVRIGTSEEEVARRGLDVEARRLLGYSEGEAR